MSRCFPLRPHGYSGNCSSNEALILSIKLHREREKSNPDRERERTIKSSERKKDRKEKKKEGSKASSSAKKEKQKLIEELYQVDKCKVEPNGKNSVRGDVSEQLESSSVTEEHGQPYFPNVSNSSDSTSNNCKRKRLSMPPSSMQGNSIRIRLCTSHKIDEPSTSGCKEQGSNSVALHMRSYHGASHSKVQPCNIIKSDLSIRQRNLNVNAHDSSPTSWSNAAIQSVACQDKAVPCLLPQKTEFAVSKEKLSSCEKKLLKKESKYNKLFSNWIVSPLASGLVANDEDDGDWLFDEKGEDRAPKRLKSSDSESFRVSFRSSALQPQSMFLPGADIYALPFTVPF